VLVNSYMYVDRGLLGRKMMVKTMGPLFTYFVPVLL
jgi:hypothetical protein